MANTYLVTGMTGFIGSFVCERLVKAGDAVVGLDVADDTSLLETLDVADNVLIEECDVTDPDAVDHLFDRYDPDYVIHLASLLMDGSSESPGLAFEVNCGGSRTVFEVAIDHNVERVVYASSTSVYAEAPRYDAPIDEDAMYDPETFYGACKLFNDNLAVKMMEVADGSTEFVGLRPSIVYGPYRETGGSAFLVDMIEKPLAGEDISVQYGDQPIDWVYVRDVARAFYRASLADDLTQSVYNVCGEYLQIGHAAEMVSNAFDGEVTVSNEGTLPLLTHDLDDSAAAEDFGYTPAYSFRDSIEDFRAEYQSE